MQEMQETGVQYLGREDPLEKERVPHALWLANILRINLYP